MVLLQSAERHLGEVVDANAIFQVINPAPLVPPTSRVGVHPQALLLASLPLPPIDATVRVHVPLRQHRARFGKHQVGQKTDCSDTQLALTYCIEVCAEIPQLKDVT